MGILQIQSRRSRESGSESFTTSVIQVGNFMISFHCALALLTYYCPVSCNLCLPKYHDYGDYCKYSKQMIRSYKRAHIFTAWFWGSIQPWLSLSMCPAVLYTLSDSTLVPQVKKITCLLQGQDRDSDHLHPPPSERIYVSSTSVDKCGRWTLHGTYSLSISLTKTGIFNHFALVRFLCLPTTLGRT